MLLNAKYRLNSSGIDHTSRVHTRHDTSNLCALLEVLTKENIAHCYGYSYGQEATQDGSYLQAGIAARKATAKEHHRNSQRYRSGCRNILNNSYFRNIKREVSDEYAQGVEYHHRANLIEERNAAT